MSRCRSSILFPFLLLTGCASDPAREAVIGQAFVGPSSLQLRQDLAARAPVSATVRHGDKLDVLARRRRFLKVRTVSGAEGWVDSGLLLSTADMDALRMLAAQVAQSSSQGKATVFETLNVHTVPNRQAPSFFQIAQHENVDVIAHESSPRVPYQPPEFVDPRPVRPPKKVSKKQEALLPPSPKAPSPPANWIELSRSSSRTGIAPAPPPPPSPAVPLDKWTLVRASDGKSGWVLTRMLFMAVPDEVAQYAERARITSYFAIGRTLDRGQAKTTWLWSTLSQPDAPFTFDSLRIFAWGARNHRYETSFIERNMRGYLPLNLKQEAGAVTGFSVIVQEKDGRVVEREYRLQSNRAKVVARKQASIPASRYSPRAASPAKPGAGEAGEKPEVPVGAGIWEKIKGYFKR